VARGLGGLREDGRKSRGFAERYHDPVVVARQVMAALDLAA
jgi:hypothetical protein